MMRRSRAASVSDEYAAGRREGLRLALGVLALEQAKWATSLGESPSWRTNAIREARHKTLQVAQRRVHTVPNRLKRKADGVIVSEFTAALKQAGL